MEKDLYPNDFPTHDKRALASFLLQNSNTLFIMKSEGKWTVQTTVKFGVFNISVSAKGRGDTFGQAIAHCVKHLLLGVPKDLY